MPRRSARAPKPSSKARAASGRRATTPLTVRRAAAGRRASTPPVSVGRQGASSASTRAQPPAGDHDALVQEITSLVTENVTSAVMDRLDSRLDDFLKQATPPTSSGQPTRSRARKRPSAVIDDADYVSDTVDGPSRRRPKGRKRRRTVAADSDRDSDSDISPSDRRRHPRFSPQQSELSDIDDQDDDAFSHLVAGSLNEVLKRQGETGDPGVGQSSHDLMGLEDPLSESVSQKTRKRILNDKYVDLKTLLLTADKEKEVNIKLKDNRGGREVSVSESARGSEIHNIHQWTDAFCIYSAVYSEAFPAMAPALFKYMHTVREIAKCRGNWKMYDESFRKKRETKLRPFDKVDWMLMWRYGGNPQVNQPQQNQSFPGKDRKGGFKSSGQKSRVQDPLFPKGHCFAFARGETCRDGDSCRFKHFCSLCGSRQHGSTKCQVKTPGKAKSANTSQSK